LSSRNAWVCIACGQVAVGAGPIVRGSTWVARPCSNVWCAAPGRPLEAVFFVGNYEGALRKAIVAYKYRWDLRWARTFAGILYGFLARHATWFEEYGVICPVPQFMGPGGRRPWGHMGLVCAEVSRLAEGGWPAENLVTKLFETDVMSTKGRAARRELAGGPLGQAFAVPDREAVRGRRVLLVDDVCVSGYTLLAVARALRSAGALEVAALVLARARWRAGPEVEWPGGGRGRLDAK
jgi:predicted amidophosphoribosyltransferase